MTLIKNIIHKIKTDNSKGTHRRDGKEERKRREGTKKELRIMIDTQRTPTSCPMQFTR